MGDLFYLGVAVLFCVATTLLIRLGTYLQGSPR